MYFLRQLKKFLLPVKMLVNFYTAIIESVLTSSITVWFAAATARDKAKLQRVIHSAEKVIGCSLPSLQELYVSRSRRRAAKIAADPSHPVWKGFGSSENPERSEEHGEASGGSKEQGEASVGSEEQGEASGGSEEQGEASGGSEGHGGKARGVPSDIHSQAEEPSDVHRRAAEPSDVCQQAAEPSNVPRRAVELSDDGGGGMSLTGTEAEQ
ncbi:hypothetical protein QTP86_016935, partial [Hemibagrus guttatus]